MGTQPAPKKKTEPGPEKVVSTGGGEWAGEEVVLRIVRPVGKALYYDARFDREQRGKNQYIETGKYYLIFHCNDRTAEGLDRVSIVRTFLDRSRKERFENNKEIDRVLPCSTEFVNLGPNVEVVAQQPCYAMDGQHRVAYRAEEGVSMKDGRRFRGTVLERGEDTLLVKTDRGTLRLEAAQVAGVETIPQPHVLHYDTPHYLFPIFPARPVGKGQGWSFRVPVIIPMGQGEPGAAMPTQFMVSVKGTLRELMGRGASRIAVVDYRFDGRFDSSLEEGAKRFAPEFRERNRIVHALIGEGTLRLDLVKGKILDKEESFKVELMARSSIPKPENKPPQEEVSEAVILSRFKMALLPPGTALRNGSVVPPDE